MWPDGFHTVIGYEIGGNCLPGLGSRREEEVFWFLFFILFSLCLFVLTLTSKTENNLCKIILSGNEREGSWCSQGMGRA